MKFLPVFVILLMFHFTVEAQKMTVKKVLKSYHTAKGSEVFAKINSYSMEGIVLRNDAMPVIFYRSRPNKYMMKYDVADLTAYRVFDGENAWFTAPWRGTVVPTLMPDDQALNLRLTADFDDILSTWKIKGHTMVLLPNAKFNDKDHFILEMKYKDSENIDVFYIDKQTYLLSKIEMTRKNGEKIDKNETVFMSYKSVGGIMFPFLVENYVNGFKASSIEYDEIILNVKLADDQFLMSRYQ